jgi:orotate phosphoribosyltransferase-like protein
MSAAATRKALEEADNLERTNQLALKAYRMRKRGASWWDIAEELKITEEAASTLVRHKIREAAALVDRGAKLELLQLEIERLDEMQWAVYDKATKGDLKAVETVLKIQAQRVRFMGLDTDDNLDATTIVVSTDPTEYIRALKEARLNREIEA